MDGPNIIVSIQKEEPISVQKDIHILYSNQPKLYWWQNIKHIWMVLLNFSRLSILAKLCIAHQNLELFYYSKVINKELYQSWWRHGNSRIVPT